MISISELKAGAKGGSVVFDKTGKLVDTVSPVEGPATLLVSEMTDALKTVDDDLITGSVDRREVWVVDLIVLDVSVLDLLEGDYEVEELIDAVVGAGLEWRVSPTSAP